MTKRVWEEEFRMDAHEERDEARQEAEHQFMMTSDDDIDYRYNYLNTRTNIRETLDNLKSHCKMYDLDFDEIVDIYKDEL